MAESLEARQSILGALEEIHKTLVAASNKMAQVQLDAMDDSDTADAVADAMNDLGSVIEAVDSLTQSYQMETNRLSNEGALDN